MFSKFAAWYGHVWRSQFKDESFFNFAKKEWQEGLNRFDDRILEQAVLNCRDACEFPPTLPQIIKCCREIINNNNYFVANYDYKPAHPSTVMSHLEQCKSFLIKQGKSSC